MAWTSARVASAACTAEDMQLVKIDDQAEQDLVHATATEVFGQPRNFLIGATDRDVQHQWVWPDGTPFWQGLGNGSAVGEQFANWRNTQPDNADSTASIDEDCAIMEQAGTWDDKQCTDSFRFVCERY